MRVSRVILHQDGTLFAMICAKRPAAASRSRAKASGCTGPGTAPRPGRRSTHRSSSSIPRTSPSIRATARHPGGRLRCGRRRSVRRPLPHRRRRQDLAAHRPRRPADLRRLLPPEARRLDLHDAHRGRPGAGLWLSRDNGQTWQAFDDLPFSNIQRVDVRPVRRGPDLRHHLRRQRLARTGDTGPLIPACSSYHGHNRFVK